MKTHLKEICRAVLSAVTSPTVVPVEKKVAVFLAVRGLVALGASSGLVLLVQHLKV
jgi:hypothetical protein